MIYVSHYPRQVCYFVAVSTCIYECMYAWYFSDFKTNSRKASKIHTTRSRTRGVAIKGLFVCLVGNKNRKKAAKYVCV